MLSMHHIINTYNAIQHRTPMPVPMPMSNNAIPDAYPHENVRPMPLSNDAAQMRPTKMHSNANMKVPKRQTLQCYSKASDVANPTPGPWIIGQLLPLVHFGDAFQQSPVINLNQFLLSFSHQIQTADSFQEIDRRLSAVRFDESNLLEPSTSSGTSTLKRWMGQSSNRGRKSGTVPAKQLLVNVGNFGDARSKNKDAGAQWAGMWCPSTGATTACED
jgi:hypothetical protein